MFITPSFKKSLIVEQFQGNYLNSCVRVKPIRLLQQLTVWIATGTNWPIFKTNFQATEGYSHHTSLISASLPLKLFTAWHLITSVNWSDENHQSGTMIKKSFPFFLLTGKILSSVFYPKAVYFECRFWIWRSAIAHVQNWPIGHQGRVVRKPVNVNPGLNVNLSITFSYLKMFFTSNVWCSLRLLQLKTEGQTI